MIDFNKLRDPAWKAEVRAKEEARQAALEAREKQQRADVDVCQAHYQELTDKERGLVGSCHHALCTFGVITDRQETWLHDIAKRFSNS